MDFQVPQPKKRRKTERRIEKVFILQKLPEFLLIPRHLEANIIHNCPHPAMSGIAPVLYLPIRAVRELSHKSESFLCHRGIFRMVERPWSQLDSSSKLHPSRFIDVPCFDSTWQPPFLPVPRAGIEQLPEWPSHRTREVGEKGLTWFDMV